MKKILILLFTFCLFGCKEPMYEEDWCGWGIVDIGPDPYSMGYYVIL